MQNSKLRAIAVATIVMLACAVVLAPGSAEAKKRKRATLTIVAHGGDFSGRLTDKKAGCQGEREVTVFRQVGSQPTLGGDQEIASDTTDDSGRWNTGNNGADNGTYYAHTPATSDCTARTSKTVRVTGRPPQPGD